MLGVGDFYYELGIQIVETCLVLQEQTGGLTELSIIKQRVSRLRGGKTEISEYGMWPINQIVCSEDIQRAVGTLKPLGSGYAVFDIGNRKVIQSVPLELSADGSRLISFAEARGFVARTDCSQLGWRVERFDQAIRGLVGDGLAWIDSQEADTQYWFPCFYQGFGLSAL